MATIYIDNQPYADEPEAEPAPRLSLAGLNLPYFCWHPALGSVGACRQCAVKQFKDEEDTHGKIVMACMTPAAEGTRISIQRSGGGRIPRGHYRRPDAEPSPRLPGLRRRRRVPPAGHDGDDRP